MEKNDLSVKTIHLDDFKFFLKEQNISRAFLPVDDLTIILFGRYRISYNPKTYKFSIKIKKHYSLTESRWVNCPPKTSEKIFSKINFYYSNAKEENVLESLLDFLSVSVTLDTLKDFYQTKHIITGEVNCSSLLAFDECDWEDKFTPEQISNMKGTLVPSTYDTKDMYFSGYVLESKKNIKVQFVTDSKGHLVPKNSDLAFHAETELHKVISHLARSGRFSNGWMYSIKAISQWIRNTANKSYLSTMLRTFLYEPFYALDVNQYHYVVKRKISLEVGNLLPILSHSVFTVKNMQSFDYSNKSFIKLFHTHPDLIWVTNNDISVLRKTPRSLLAQLFKHASRLDFHFRLHVLLFLQRSELSKHFPRKILMEIIRKSPVKIIEKNEQRIVNLWMSYYKNVWRETGYLKSLQQWDHYLRQLCHALDFARHTNAVISKSFNWHSIQQCVQRWDEERTAKTPNSYPQFSWPACHLSHMIVGCFEFVEICDSKGLEEEGKLLNHCVIYYANECYESSYRVFAVKSLEERATLGVHNNIEESKVYLDQVRGYGNGAVSDDLLKAANNFINLLNQSIVRNVA